MKKIFPVKISLYWYYWFLTLFLIGGIFLSHALYIWVYLTMIILISLFLINWILIAFYLKEKKWKIIVFSFLYFFTLKFLLLLNTISIAFFITAIKLISEHNFNDVYDIIITLLSLSFTYLTIKIVNYLKNKNNQRIDNYHKLTKPKKIKIPEEIKEHNEFTKNWINKYWHK